MLAATDSKSAWNAWALVLVLAITFGGGAWILAWTLSTNFVRLGAAIDRNHEAVERNARAQAAAIARVQKSVDANRVAIEVNRTAIAENAAAIAKLTGEFAEHTRQPDRLANR